MLNLIMTNGKIDMLKVTNQIQSLQNSITELNYISSNKLIGELILYIQDFNTSSKCMLSRKFVNYEHLQ